MCYTLQQLSRWDKNSALAPARICYLGDLISRKQLIVAGLRYPVVNEVGVFFINNLESAMAVSPLVSLIIFDTEKSVSAVGPVMERPPCFQRR